MKRQCQHEDELFNDRNQKKNLVQSNSVKSNDYNTTKLNEIYIMALRHENGLGIEKNYQKSFELFSICANSGDPYAQYALAQYYEYGKGIAADNMKALEYYNMAAQKGHPDAQNYLIQYNNFLNAKNKRKIMESHDSNSGLRNVLGRYST